MGDDRRAAAWLNRGNIKNHFGRILVWLCKCIVVVLLLYSINNSIEKSSKTEFLGNELYSELVSQDAEKRVENLGRAGNLTYGPYISLERGDYEVTVFYHTDKEGNYVDAFTGKTGTLLYQDTLEPGMNQKNFRLALNEKISALEIRSYYMGDGVLEIEKIIIEKSPAELFFSRIIAIVLLLGVIILYEVKIKKLSYEVKFACFVILLLFVPMLLGFAGKATAKQLDRELAGNFDTYEKPEFTFEDFSSGAFQRGYENWWNENFVPRGYIISAYNQLRYSMFGLGNRIIGKGNSIYEDVYLADVFGTTINRDYSYAENQAAMRTYAEQLESISNNLRLLGKEFLVYTTMSKAAEMPEDIPDKYALKYGEKGNVRAIDYFRSIIGEYEIPYFDTKELLERVKPEYPIFYKTGIHWSRPLEQEVSLELLNILREWGVPVGTFELKKLMESDTPYWRDDDVYGVLNIYQGTMDPAYYEYETAVVETGTANLLLQGGSFGLGFKKDFIENLAGAGIVNFFYNQYVETPTGGRFPISSWEAVDFASYIETADAVIIEINEHSLYAYSDGFVEYLSRFLESYVEEFREVLEIQNKIEYSGNISHGFHELEGNFRWTEHEARIKFVDDAVTKKGLEIELFIPNELSAEGNVTIVVGGIATQTISLADKGRHILTFAPEELQGIDRYDIVIVSSDAFVPAEEGLNADTRELALQIYYIGEKR